MRLSLSNFRSWMGLERKLAPSTVLLYGNYARALLRDQDSAVALLHDPERFVARAAEYDAQLCSTSRCGFRSSLRMFAQYIEAREGVHINFVFPRERDTIRPVSILGPPLRDFQEHLIPFSRLEFIRWRDVTRSGSKGCLTDVAYGQSYFAEIETVQALNMWAGGGQRADPNQPIIPTAPKSFTPMATRRLLRLARGT